MRGSRAKLLRRAAYGPRSEWTKEGYFPLHPQHRGYTIMQTFEKIVPRLIRADLDDGTDAEKKASIKMPGAGGHLYHYRYVPWQHNGMHHADVERRKYQAAKKWWKRHRIESTRLKGW